MPGPLQVRTQIMKWVAGAAVEVAVVADEDWCEDDWWTEQGELSQSMGIVYI